MEEEFESKLNAAIDDVSMDNSKSTLLFMLLCVNAS